MILLETPTKLRLEGYTKEQLEPHLGYHDMRVEHEYRRFKESHWMMSKLGQEEYDAKLKELKERRYGIVLFEDEQGLWTYSGFKSYLQEKFQDIAGTQVQLPEPQPIPWRGSGPPKKPREYQLAAVEALLKAGGHGAVEMGTGLGKGFIIALMLKQLGLPALIMAPSVSIFNQLRDDLTAAFGKHVVGALGDGKRDLKKKFVVAIAASLARVEEGTPEWDNISQRQIFIADESHQCPASTLASVCMKLMTGAPYRFFFSGTQLRNDGLDKLLLGITGPVVYRMSVKEGVEQGWLAKPKFTTIWVRSPSNREYREPNDQTREHLYYNPVVAATAGDVANMCVNVLKRPTLILVEEVEQFTRLLPYLRHKVGFAHGGLNKDNRDRVPEAYHQSDPTKLVKEFNEGKLPILVGTSCIGTGTDIRAAEALIYLQGGQSEIKVRQAIGRGTRGGNSPQVSLLNPWTEEKKTDCLVFDFAVSTVQDEQGERQSVTLRHALERKAIYEDIGGPSEDMRP